jgi:hypothetical protein
MERANKVGSAATAQERNRPAPSVFWIIFKYCLKIKKKWQQGPALISIEECTLKYWLKLFTEQWKHGIRIRPTTKTKQRLVTYVENSSIHNIYQLKEQ